MLNDTPREFKRFFILLFSIISILLIASTSFADEGKATNLDNIGTTPIGLISSYYQETQALTLEQAFEKYYQQQFQPASEEVLNFSIGPSPVWVAFSIDNHHSNSQQRYFSIDTSWLDSIDIIVKNRNTNDIKRYHVGDKVPFSQRPLDTRNFVVDLDLVPGITDVMFYVKTADSMVLPFYLLTEQQQQNKDTLLQYGYGLVYGYLIALLMYNAILFLGMKDIRYLLYSALLASFLFGNIAYTGHGYMWLWPESISFQQWGQSLLMILYASSGLLFALYFLDIKSLSKRLFSLALSTVVVIYAVYIYTFIADKAVASTQLSFLCVSSYMLVTLGLGFYAIYHRQKNATYFLGAISLGSIGTGITSLAAWGGLPLTTFTFHAAELGMVAEATLLALALTHHFRMVQTEKFIAEKMAGLDPLTQLYNRRGFEEALSTIWQTICRHDLPVSVVMIDLDNFKKLNDTYGHEVGDIALKNVAHRLTQEIRTGDIVARWGGEEFLLFLPETLADQAYILAERIRLSITQDVIVTPLGNLSVTASLGIAQKQKDHTTLAQVVDYADKALYDAKRNGKNRTLIFGDKILQVVKTQAV